MQTRLIIALRRQPGDGAEAGPPLPLERRQRISVPPAFAVRAYPLRAPGTTSMVVDAAVVEDATGPARRTIGAESPAG